MSERGIVTHIIKAIDATNNEIEIPLECGYHCTDDGNAKRLVSIYGNDIRYCAAEKSYYVWDDRRWVIDTQERVREMAKEVVHLIHQEVYYAERDPGWDKKEIKKLSDWAFQSESAKLIDAMLKLARSDSRIIVSPEEFDTDPYLLSCESGTIDYKNCPREKPYRKWRREDLITQFTPRHYNPEANGEVWYKTLFGALPIISVFFLQDSFGYSSTHAFHHKMFWYAYGIPDGRKSSVIDPPFRALGDYVGAFEYRTFLKSYEQVGGPRADIIDLERMRAAQCSELPKGFVINDSLIKSVTSANRKRARGMYQVHGQDVEVKTKLWFESNFMAKVDFEDEANYNRLNVIVFNRKLPEGMIDESILEFLRTDPESLDATFTWFVDGTYEWMEHGLQRPPEVDAATKQYQKMMNPLNWFLDEYCIKDENAKINATILFERFKSVVESLPKELRETVKEEMRGVKSFGKSFKKICDSKRLNDGVNYLGIRLPLSWSEEARDVDDDIYMKLISDDSDYFENGFQNLPCTLLAYREFRERYSESSLSSLIEVRDSDQFENELDQFINEI
jgi:putative DNA primase/helicase